MSELKLGDSCWCSVCGKPGRFGYLVHGDNLCWSSRVPQQIVCAACRCKGGPHNSVSLSCNAAVALEMWGWRMCVDHADAALYAYRCRNCGMEWSPQELRALDRHLMPSGICRTNCPNCTPPLPPDPGCLYRMFGKRGGLLYIGKTTRPHLRFKSHAKEKAWWRQVARIELEHFEDGLSKAEVRAIKQERPRYNIAYRS